MTRSAFILCLLVVSACAKPLADKVKVSIYEESLCPACIGWFSGAFGPGTGAWAAYEAVGDIMDLDVTMWGNAQGTAAAPTCQHGAVECLAQKYTNCVKGIYPFTAYINFVHCFDDTLMKTFPQGLPVGIVNATFATTTITKCAAANAIDMSKLTTCYNGPDGTKYLQAAKDATPPHKAIPILVVAGNTSCPPPKDVIGAVCAAYTGTHPNCTKHEENVEIAQPCNTEYCSQITVDVDTGAEASFRTFLTTYNKEYKNATEFAYRLEVFKKNLQIAEQRNADGEAVHGITKFSDLTNEEFRSFYLGYKAPTGARQELDIALTDSSAAASVDWRGHSPAILTPVKNQAQCGSCWAFSATEQIETNYAMAGNAIKSLGVQQIVSCDKVDDGCNGGNTETAYAYVEKAGGLETEASYPYTSGKGKSGVCKDKKAKEVVSIKGFNTISKTEASEKKMVTQMGDSPISVCVDATKWQTYKKGILGRTCGKQLDHCVQAVGLNTDGAKPYWIVRNSWASDWGVDGYIYVEEGINACGIAKDATTVNI